MRELMSKSRPNTLFEQAFYDLREKAKELKKKWEEEAKAKLADAEFKRRKVMVDAQVERLERDRERVLNHVIPQRFSRRGEAQVWPLGVRVILPTSEVNA